MVKQEQRKYGEDSVYYSKERQCFVAQMNKTLDGVQHRPSATGRTEKEAERKLAKKKRQFLEENGLQKKTKISFGHELDKMMQTICGTVEDKSYNDYEYRAKLLQSMSFFSRNMAAIDLATIQQDLNRLCAEKELSKSVCGKLIAFIKRVYTFGMKNRDLSFNPVEERKSLKVPVCAKAEKSVLPLCSEDLNALLQELEYIGVISPIVSELYGAGVSIQESLALKWHDNNARSLVIRNELRRVRNTAIINGKAKSFYIWEMVPARKPRTEPISQNLYQSLTHLRALNRGPLIFCKANGSHHDYDSFPILIETGIRLKPMIYCMLMCGHRYGEVAALSWDMMNFRTGIIKICQAVKCYENRDRTADDGQPKHCWKIGPPKTRASNRTTKMRQQLTSCLLEWKRLQPIYAPDKTGQNLVFPKANGALQDYDSFETILRTFLERIDLEPSIYHTRVFRHTFASYCVKSGVKPKTLQRILGHADIITTLKHYVDTDEESIDEAFEAMESAVENVSTYNFRNVG